MPGCMKAARSAAVGSGVTERGVRVDKRMTDGPAAVREPTSLQVREMVAARLEGAQGRDERHLPAGPGVLGTEKRQVEPRVVRGDRSTGQTGV